MRNKIAKKLRKSTKSREEYKRARKAYRIDPDVMIKSMRINLPSIHAKLSI